MTDHETTRDRARAQDVIWRVTVAVETLCVGKGDVRSRLKSAVVDLIPLQEQDFPVALRARRIAIGERSGGRRTASPWASWPSFCQRSRSTCRVVPSWWGSGETWTRSTGCADTPTARSGCGMAGASKGLYHRALDFTANEHPTPLDHREVHHIAKSVARWVWRRFSAEGFAAKQAARGRIGGRASGEARWGRTSRSG